MVNRTKQPEGCIRISEKCRLRVVSNFGDRFPWGGRNTHTRAREISRRRLLAVYEECVFVWKSLSSRYQEQLKWVFFGNCSFTSTLLELNKLALNATRRAVGKSRAEVFSLKKNKPAYSFVSGLHVFPCCFSPLEKC